MNEPDNTSYENGDVPDPTADEPDEFEQLSELADAGELTEERLQETLNSYAKAFQEEFANSVAKSPEDVEVYTTRLLQEERPQCGCTDCASFK